MKKPICFFEQKPPQKTLFYKSRFEGEDVVLMSDDKKILLATTDQGKLNQTYNENFTPFYMSVTPKHLSELTLSLEYTALRNGWIYPYYKKTSKGIHFLFDERQTFKAIARMFFIGTLGSLIGVYSGAFFSTGEQALRGGNFFFLPQKTTGDVSTNSEYCYINDIIYCANFKNASFRLSTHKDELLGFCYKDKKDEVFLAKVQKDDVVVSSKGVVYKKKDVCVSFGLAITIDENQEPVFIFEGAYCKLNEEKSALIFGFFDEADESQMSVLRSWVRLESKVIIIDEKCPLVTYDYINHLCFIYRKHLVKIKWGEKEILDYAQIESLRASANENNKFDELWWYGDGSAKSEFVFFGREIIKPKDAKDFENFFSLNHEKISIGQRARGEAIVKMYKTRHNEPVLVLKSGKIVVIEDLC